mmetsp:Transcript_16487/g.19499  ORF Transcript_16487/g.19499 Transcript_16487/m.19499 type:complete len:145 (-) Transcript_16487:286-720(-)|eukprot:CAMPEP_0114350586 /NCGR_PEP_ID=MMETSP0101-20121206/16486_1 /TAXON_ID=38822 ORGANISM="Pteridomonas danica, Strain PT" /NCGR_SAMPLE_ID=MMETSP0101 /ASSEMBLY_ACC=CAM_ASM_000211 /LENGTH=144 /DNA_ID=CAMNT_0001489919 /DNA_START=79 /DNA_END=513 /DNA_ORIENTATION=-
MNESEEVINSSLSPTPSPSFIYHFATHHGHKADEADFFLIFVATIGGMIGMLTILMLYRHCLKKREFTYTRVHHGLDPEEQEFKRALESQTDEIDELFNFNDEFEDSADLKFDAAELEKIEMLDSYRDKLVTETNDDNMALPEV